jgi:hypothetical protein
MGDDKKDEGDDDSTTFCRSPPARVMDDERES